MNNFTPVFSEIDFSSSSFASLPIKSYTMKINGGYYIRSYDAL